MASPERASPERALHRWTCFAFDWKKDCSSSIAVAVAEVIVVVVIAAVTVGAVAVTLAAVTVKVTVQ